MTTLRGVEKRIDWFLEHNPSAVGMCLNHTWLATDIPPAGCADANACVDYVRKHGELRDSRKAPRGAWVLYRSSTYGHAALSLGDGKIASTDVNGPATTGKVPLDYPMTHWGHSYAGWTDWYGVRFPVAEGGDDVPLTDDEIERIAKRVWNFAIAEGPDSKQEQAAKAYLRETWRRAGRAAEQEQGGG